MASVLRIPKPPEEIGLKSWSLLIRCMCFLFSVSTQKKLMHIESILRQTCLGKEMQDSKWMLEAVRTDLIRVSLEACERRDNFQEAVRLETLSIS